ncbi:hypothetical protein JTE90_007656 [Oedothorax gibbosus]|uniref:Uncharacterized protein n=1 Tax=Oedothorax gibbosus TaxID=931172 RepID=A0AAV6TSE9_9ARAC|nr:hypothetical protein JTE90_007656 [Oedothorax gibbosus]
MFGVSPAESTDVVIKILSLEEGVTEGTGTALFAFYEIIMIIALVTRSLPSSLTPYRESWTTPMWNSMIQTISYNTHKPKKVESPVLVIDTNEDVTAFSYRDAQIRRPPDLDIFHPADLVNPRANRFEYEWDIVSEQLEKKLKTEENTKQFEENNPVSASIQSDPPQNEKRSKRKCFQGFLCSISEYEWDIVSEQLEKKLKTEENTKQFEENNPVSASIQSDPPQNEKRSMRKWFSRFSLFNFEDQLSKPVIKPKTAIKKKGKLHYVVEEGYKCGNPARL